MKSLTVLGLGVVITMGCDVFEPGLHGSAPAVRSTAVTLSPAAHLAAPAPAPAPAPTLALAPTPTLAPALAPPEDVELFELGSHHGVNVPESIGRSDWLALCQVGGAFELTKAALTVEPVNDPLIDDAEEQSGRQISATACSSPVVLLRGRGLVAGPVRQASVTTDAVRFAGTTLGLARVDRSVGSDPDEKLALLEVKTEAARSVLGSSPNATIVWAGDLDRDGNVDFLVQESVDSRSETTLFLSSFSPPGEVAMFAATTARGGC